MPRHRTRPWRTARRTGPPSPMTGVDTRASTSPASASSKEPVQTDAIATPRHDAPRPLDLAREPPARGRRDRRVKVAHDEHVEGVARSRRVVRFDEDAAEYRNGRGRSQPRSGRRERVAGLPAPRPGRVARSTDAADGGGRHTEASAESLAVRRRSLAECERVAASRARAAGGRGGEGGRHRHPPGEQTSAGRRGSDPSRQDTATDVRTAPCHRTPPIERRRARTSRGGQTSREDAGSVRGATTCGSSDGDAGVMIDLSAMRGVRVDPERRRAWVEGGATWGEVDRETQVFGLATPGGLISDTGVAGSRSAAASAGCGAATACPSTTCVGRRRDGGRATGPRERGREHRSALGAQGRRRQFRCRDGVRVRPASGRPDGDVLRPRSTRSRRGPAPSASGAISSPTRTIASARWSNSRPSRWIPTIPRLPGACASTRWPQSTRATPRGRSAAPAAAGAGRAGARLLWPDGLLRHPAALRHA